MRTLAIYPGRFHPAHKGHKAVYDYLVNQFGKDNVYIAMSNDTSSDKSPFSFKERVAIWNRMFGIPVKNMYLTPSPYNIPPEHILPNPESVAVVYAVSEKDMSDNPRFSFPSFGLKRNKNGSLAVIQRYTGENISPASKHLYIYTVPTITFSVNGQRVSSATQMREMLADPNESNARDAFIDLYGKFDPKVFNLIRSKLLAPDVDTRVLEHKHFDFDPDDLEAYRTQVLREVFSNTKRIIDIASEVLSSDILGIEPTGDVISRSNFRPESDITVRVLVHDDSMPEGVDIRSSGRLQREFLEVPFSFGLISIIVHNIRNDNEGDGD